MIKKIALITGASRGLGAALSERLSETHHIIAVARTVGGLEGLDDRIKSKNLEIAIPPFILATLIALAIVWIIEKKIPMVPLLGGILITFFGGLTIYLSLIHISEPTRHLSMG